MYVADFKLQLKRKFTGVCKRQEHLLLPKCIAMEYSVEHLT